MDLTDGGHAKVKDYYLNISPMHNIRKGMPPTIVFLGTQDKLIPVKTATTFQQKMKAVKSTSLLYLYEGKSHGFFNYGRDGGSAYRTSVTLMDHFLVSLGYLEGKSTIRLQESEPLPPEASRQSK